MRLMTAIDRQPATGALALAISSRSRSSAGLGPKLMRPPVSQYTARRQPSRGARDCPRRYRSAVKSAEVECWGWPGTNPPGRRRARLGGTRSGRYGGRERGASGTGRRCSGAPVLAASAASAGLAASSPRRPKGTRASSWLPPPGEDPDCWATSNPPWEPLELRCLPCCNVGQISLAKWCDRWSAMPPTVNVSSTKGYTAPQWRKSK